MVAAVGAGAPLTIVGSLTHFFFFVFVFSVSLRHAVSYKPEREILQEAPRVGRPLASNCRPTLVVSLTREITIDNSWPRYHLPANPTTAAEPPISAALLSAAPSGGFGSPRCIIIIIIIPSFVQKLLQTESEKKKNALRDSSN